VSYDDIVAAFIEPPLVAIAPPLLPQSPARRLRDALEPIATQGWWSRSAAEHVEATGLGFFDAYVWGRAAALGEPAAATVVATFGVFEPQLLSMVYEHGSTGASRDAVLAAREAGAIASLASMVSASEAELIAEPLLDALSGLDGMGRALFASLRALPLPSSPNGRLWRAAELVREHRGDGHLAACVTSGLDAVTMNVLTELWLDYTPGEYSATRGYGIEAITAATERLNARGWMVDGVLSDAGREARDEIEAATDRSQDALIAALGHRLEEIIRRSDVLASRILAGRAFPHDPRKRAAG
jgi:hypothetical protein